MGKKGRILLVDDEASVTSALARVLRRAKWEVVTATSPEAGLGILAVEAGFSVVVSDFRMPGLSGADFLEKVKQAQPDCTRVLLTGYADIQGAMDAINRGAVFKFLVKPWNEPELLEALALAQGQYELIEENRRLSRELAEKNEELQSLNAGLEQRVMERTSEVEGLNRNLQSSLMGTIKVMAALSEKRTDELKGYTRRVSGLAGALARRMRLAPGEIFQVQAAGFLHEIGAGFARGAADAYQRSAELIRLVPNMQRVAELVEELKGERATIGARVLHVAITFERSLNSRAAIRSANPLSVLEGMERGRPVGLDPAVVAALREHLVASNQLREELYELQIGTQELRPGMVLASELLARNGQLLLSRGTEITLSHLESLRQRADQHLPVAEVFVFRRTATAA